MNELTPTRTLEFSGQDRQKNIDQIRTEFIEFFWDDSNFTQHKDGEPTPLGPNLKKLLEVIATALDKDTDKVDREDIENFFRPYLHVAGLSREQIIDVLSLFSYVDNDPYSGQEAFQNRIELISNALAINTSSLGHRVAQKVSKVQE